MMVGGLQAGDVEGEGSGEAEARLYAGRSFSWKRAFHPPAFSHSSGG